MASPRESSQPRDPAQVSCCAGKAFEPPLVSLTLIEQKYRERSLLSGSPSSENECWVLSHVQLFVTPWTEARQAPLVHGVLQARIPDWGAISFSNLGLEPTSLALVRQFLYH